MAVSHTDEMRENRDGQIEGVMQDGVKWRKVVMFETTWAPVRVILLKDVFVCFIQQRVWRSIQNTVMFIYSLLSLSTCLCILPVFLWVCELRDFGCRSKRNLCVYVHWWVHSYNMWHSFSECVCVCVSVWVSYAIWHTHTLQWQCIWCWLHQVLQECFLSFSCLSQSCINDRWWGSGKNPTNTT